MRPAAPPWMNGALLADAKRVLDTQEDPRRGNDEKFFDIGFAAFQGDPIAEIKRLYEWLGRDLTAETEQRMLDWREDNPRDKHGTHSYSAEEFGMTEPSLQARFGAYRHRFAPLLR